MKTSNIVLTLAFILSAQTSFASTDISFKSQCSKAYENIQSIENVLDQFKPGERIVGSNKDLVETKTGFDVTSVHKMTNGLRIKLIKKVSKLQNDLNNCDVDSGISKHKSYNNKKSIKI